MNAQEKKIHINLTWSFVKSALLLLGSLLGKDGLIEKVKDLLDGKDEASADETPKCPAGYTWDGTQCVKDPGI